MATSKYYQDHRLTSRTLGWGKVGIPHSFVPKIFCDIFYFPLRVVFNFFFRLEVESREDLKKLTGPLIIVSNHASWIDPFLIGMAFPFNAKIFPIRYATLWKYYYFPVFTFLIWLFGGFPIRKGIGLEKSLAVPEEILGFGGVVGIFPTGKRTRVWNKNQPVKPKRGAAYLAIKTNTYILPVKIEGNMGMNFKGFLTRKYKIKIKTGKEFLLPYQNLNNVEKLNYPADYVMAKINRL